jgi:hypothetical protein
MTSVVEKVAARFKLQGGSKFRLPPEIEASVDEQAVTLWREVSRTEEKAARGLSYGAFYIYWLNKCGENNLTLPKSVQKVPGTLHGPWPIRPTDQIEEWARQTVRSNTLLKEVGLAANTWLRGLSRPVSQPGATREVERLLGELTRYVRAKSYAIEFEKEVQFLLLLLAKDLDRTEILDATQLGLFEALQSWVGDLRVDIQKLSGLFDRSDA